MNASRERGFSVIELVVVITILGVLAAFAVPRFVALDSQARAATVNGLAGSVKSAASLARGLAMATNTGASGSVTMEGQTITLFNSYPDAQSIAHAVPSDSRHEWMFTPGTATTVSTWRKRDAAMPAHCVVNYLPATASTPPQVTVDTSQC